MAVDDSLITLKKIELLFQELNCEVTYQARTGREAVSAYATVRPDIVSMDISMPDMDGIEATKRIIKIDPKALIIMVTSHGQEQMVMDAIAAGAKGYVLKPVKQEKLQQVVNGIVKKYLSA
ncbi:response regulator [Ectothiorhodospiraceae bacterium BW-2]|nr:response regulator [Ectothiorhodospiraceae bacterium BW-2]